jgi:hypothetical protein
VGLSKNSVGYMYKMAAFQGSLFTHVPTPGDSTKGVC